MCRTQQNVSLPEPGRYATGILFLDKDVKNAAAVENAFEQLAAQVNLQVGNHQPSPALRSTLIYVPTLGLGKRVSCAKHGSGLVLTIYVYVV